MILPPHGYSFIDSLIDVADLLALRKSVGWSHDDKQRWSDCLAQSLYVCGVQDDSQRLVGVGFVAGNLRHAVFCDLCVHPDHQHKKIGTTLLKQRLAWAREKGIPYLYTSLSAANPLVELYRAEGFFIAVS